MTLGCGVSLHVAWGVGVWHARRKRCGIVASLGVQYPLFELKLVSGVVTLKLNVAWLVLHSFCRVSCTLNLSNGEITIVSDALPGPPGSHSCQSLTRQ